MMAKQGCFLEHYWLVLSLSLSIVHCSTSVDGESYSGPYDHIYPYTDIRRDQLNCSVTQNITCSELKNGTCHLYIALMMSFGGDFDSRGVIPGVQLAIDQINRDPKILPGYCLHYILKATKCEAYGTVALDALHTHLLQPPTKVGVIGSGCSLATEPTAQVSQYYNVTHLSCVSASAELANRDRFRYHFQLLATEAEIAIGFYGIIKNFGWRRVAIILQEEGLFEVAMNLLVHMLENDSIDTKVKRFRSNEGISSVGEKPFDEEYRINVFAMYSGHARRLLCKAYEQDIHYPRYEFLFYGWYAENWWKVEDEVLSCTSTQLEQVIGPALSPLQNEFISNCSKTVESGISGHEFQREYERLVNLSMGPPLSINGRSIYAQQCYDATWTLVRALNRTIEDIKDDLELNTRLKDYESDLDSAANIPFALQHFSYNNSGVLELVYGYLNQTDFSGITGQVSFGTSDGVRHIPTTIVYQYRPSNIPECFTCLCVNRSLPDQSLRREMIAIVNHDDLSFELIVDEDSLWTDGVPYDGVPEDNVEIIHTAVTVVFCLLSTAGIVFSLSCMLFNYMYRDKKLIKLSSPNLNYLIVVGAIVLYVDVYLFVIPAETQLSALITCNLTPWLTAIGYSLCYGTIIVKMFRIFYIIHNLFSKKRFLKDWVLALAVVVLVSIDIFILVIYTVVELAKGNFSAILESNEENTVSHIGPTEIEFRNKFYICDSKSRDIALGILYGYKAVLQVIALIFSFSIGKVKIKGLNDAKFITIAVYVTSIVTAVIFVSLYSLKTHLNLYATLFSFGFLVGTTFILALVFLPKMITLYRDPQCKTVALNIKPKDVPGTKSEQSINEFMDGHAMQVMQKKIKELESHVQSQQRQLDLYAERDGSLQKTSEKDKSKAKSSTQS